MPPITRFFLPAQKIAVAGLLAVVVGDFCNSYTLAKMKVWNKGDRLWLRFVASTVVGEGINTLIFYVNRFVRGSAQSLADG